MPQNVLLTAATEDTEIFRSQIDQQKITLLHYPLERYQKVEEDGSILGTFEQLDNFENIVYGSKRNARFFVEKMKELERLNDVRERLNLALNQQAADYLEEESIPAIHPQANGKAINVMEFMLRTRRTGNTLYPCGDQTKEELPGFLQELDMPVKELILFTLEGPKEQELMKFREDIAASGPDAVIFHSRRSVNRTLAAFPDLNYDDIWVISGDQAVTDKLKEKGIAADAQAKGSWESILEEVNK